MFHLLDDYTLRPESLLLYSGLAFQGLGARRSSVGHANPHLFSLSNPFDAGATLETRVSGPYCYHSGKGDTVHGRQRCVHHVVCLIVNCSVLTSYLHLQILGLRWNAHGLMHHTRMGGRR